MSAQLFYSKPAKVMFYISIPVVLVTQYYNFNTLSIITQFLVYMAIAYNAECMVEGGCDLWAWLSVALPILYSLLYIFFGNQLSLSATPPSPITNIMPVQRILSEASKLPRSPQSPQNRANETIVYVDEAGNVLSTVPPAGTVNSANSHITGEPVSHSGQPSPTTGSIAEAFTI